MSYVIFLFCLFFSMISFAEPMYNVEQEKGIGILEDAFTRGAKADLIAEINDVSFKEFPNVNKVIYYRRCNQNGNNDIRADFYEGKTLIWTMLKNDDGEFIMNHRHKMAAKGGNFIRLHYPDSFNQPLYKPPFQFAEFSNLTTQYQGRTCHKIVIRLSKNIKNDRIIVNGRSLVIDSVSGFLSGDFDDFKKKYPFYREFVIDKQTGLVVSVKKLNF